MQMKKNIIFSAIVSLAASVLCLLINLVCALSSGSLPLGVTFSGGEFTEAVGFGISVQTVYSFGTLEEAGTWTTLGFHPLSLLLPWLLLCLLIFLLKMAGDRLKKPKA